MKLALSILATAALARAQDPYLNFDAYGTILQIPAASEEQYDQNQNHAAGIVPVASADGNELHIVGNRWSAYPLPETDSPLEVYDDSVLEFTFKLDADTVSGFQAVCLDADKEQTGSNGRCFVLSTSQGWIDGMTNVAETTAVGESSQISIPIGHFFTGTINYLVFIQDSDGDAAAKAAGDSTISGLKLIQKDRIKLEVEIDGTVEYLENNQLSYTTDGGSPTSQDTQDWLMAISEDGKGLQINGNQWKALALNAPITITHYTVLEFDIVVTEPGEFHAICLDDTLDNQDSCMVYKHPQDNSYFRLTSELGTGVSERLVIPYGQILGLLEGDNRTANYIAFVQDNDAGDKRGGQSTYSNIRVYDEQRTPLKISVYNQDVNIPNIQTPFTNSGSNSVQDSIDHVMSVSSDASTLTAYGNSWKRFKLDEPFTVTEATVLKFTFEATVEAESHIICLLDDSINANDGRDDCYALSGKEITGSSSAYKKVSPFTEDGHTTHYELLVGSYFTGDVLYLGFGQDNDKAFTATRAEGESSISNITIYDLPSLNVGVDGSSPTDRSVNSLSFAIANDQQSYESSSQDNTPIRDNLAIVADDGSSITVTANTWRMFPIVPPKSSAELGDFVVSFNYKLVTKAQFHAICFEDNSELGDYDSPASNEYDPKRCFLLNEFEDLSSNQVWFRGYQPALGETHRYVLNLSKFPFERFYEWKYLALIQDNDDDNSVGEMVISDLHVTTSLTSCLESTDFTFQVSDCTVENFLTQVGVQLAATTGCSQDDPLLELMAVFDAKTEMDVYKQIEHICKSSYGAYEHDFAKTISSETQLVGEFIDGGTILNYETDAEGGDLAKDGAAIAASDQVAATHLLSWPKHHALDHCDVGAAMCCWVDSRGTTALDDNTDVCYVDMKASRRTAHVADGYSIYGGGAEGAANCHGFAWGTDGGSVASALKGNALFKVGFMDNFYKDSKGNVEQVPGAPMCGCMDRMPVVTYASCTKAAPDTSSVSVTHSAATGFSAVFTMGTIQYTDCGDLNAHYKTLVAAGSPDALYMDTRIVGDGQCLGAINGFLHDKGLIKTA